MTDHIPSLLRRITALYEEVEVELAKRRRELRFAVHEGKVRFEHAILIQRKALKTYLLRHLLDARPVMLLAAPVIYAAILPLGLLDLFLGLDQATCFPVCGIEKVRRSDYLIYDRRELAYLKVIEKLNCAYCSYANGLIGYLREIAAGTEQYGCPIKHARPVVAAHQHYASFVDYGDAEAYRRQLPELRRRLRERPPDSDGRPRV